MELSGGQLPATHTFLLFAAIGLALCFEFVNGFHDTANAVATVIYTHSLKPVVAVVWSGLWNLIGVLSSTGAVAFGITALLPVELVLNVGSTAGFAMVFSLLISAIIWNLGTWYLGLPASSSHTLIGAIMGVGLANSMLSVDGGFGQGINWEKATEVGLSLLLSPALGFSLSAGLYLLAKALIHDPELFQPANPAKTPPRWIRSLLILTCTGVSFAHGSNDGQKGMGLILLILVGLLPGAYAVNQGLPPHELQAIELQVRQAQSALGPPATDLAAAQRELAAFVKPSGQAGPGTKAALAAVNDRVGRRLAGKSSLKEIAPEDRKNLRTEIYLALEASRKLVRTGAAREYAAQFDWHGYTRHLEKATMFIPFWVKVAVAIALGFGTMVGWKRIVVTVGEKIGKAHLGYAQGASAEFVAMTTIGLADFYGMPVSTTHVLSSGVAGTMTAGGSGVNRGTLRNLLLAWVLTLPVCMLLGAGLFGLAMALMPASAMK